MIKIANLILVIILAIGLSISCGKKEETKKKAAWFIPKSEELKPESAKVLLPLDKYGREDPFDRTFSKTTPGMREEVSGLILEGIVWDRDDPTAIINSKIIHTGEKIGNYEVIEIKQEKVTLSDDVQTIEVEIR